MSQEHQTAKSHSEIFSAGESAMVVEFGSGIHPDIHRKVKALADFLDQFPFPGMIEYSPSFSSVTVFYDPLKVRQLTAAQPTVGQQTSYQIVADFLQNIVSKLGHSAAVQPRVVKIPVCYGGTFGPDLEYVAAYNQLSVTEVITIHASSQYLVYMIGFAPGFPYLGGMSERIAVPRRPSPRLSIPAGSVGIAGMQTGVYPIATPGGWQLIGQTPLELFRPQDNPPTLLQSGDMIQFYSISSQEFAEYRGGSL